MYPFLTTTFFFLTPPIQHSFLYVCEGDSLNSVGLETRTITLSFFVDTWQQPPC